AELVDPDALFAIGTGARDLRGVGDRMYSVYVLKSLKDNNLYIGMTADLKKRMARHNSGYEKATRNRIPLELIHSELFATREEARKREKYLKSGFGREIIRKLLLK
ncbi:MAG: GIY-YIG nuclease family protein, partial [Candidatus Margulisiibacteriota bacterium]